MALHSFIVIDLSIGFASSCVGVLSSISAGWAGIRYARGDDDGAKWLLSYAAETAVGVGDCTSLAAGEGQGYSVALTVSEDSLLKPFSDLSRKIVGGVILAAIVPPLACSCHCQIRFAPSTTVQSIVLHYIHIESISTLITYYISCKTAQAYGSYPPVICCLE